ncbi:HPr family phosphocarrier protein [Nocardiopsis composta]|uniref:Phosphocarrier protein n=1 Tax=Nocardiopsis composta TaxID=157465 RepID=A0A7W8VEU7_9ACTN|nr:HPr family phosphocarrier protein [Nocardiopsis composta]MBB5433463.1 phosphocarrier protein [Nocardiopsis composta]
MPSTDVTIASAVGLHARPAGLFVKAAAATGVPVTIAKQGGAPVDARSLLGVMALGAGHGDTVTLTAEGEGADAALAELADLLGRDLDAA